MPDSDSLSLNEDLERRVRRERKARLEAERVAYDALNRLSSQAEQLRNRSEALARALDESRDAAEIRRKMINAAAHVLRTPLTSLMIRLHAAVARAPSDLKASLGEANRMANSMNEVLNDIMRLEQLEAGAYAVAPDRINLRNFLLARQGLTVVSSVDFEPMVVVDARYLDEALGVIRRNSAQGQDLKAIIQEKPDAIELEIQYDAGTQRDEREAVGLGQMLIERIVGAMGARVEVVEDQLGGQTVVFVLPRA